MEHTEKGRQRLTGAQWIDIVALAAVVWIYLAIKVLAGNGWWSMVLLLIQIGLLVRIGLWLVPLMKKRRR